MRPGNRRGKRDRVQPALVKRFEDLHCSVVDTSDVGDGFPDLVVGVMGMSFLVEVKDPARPDSYTPEQERFYVEYRGTVYTCCEPDGVDLLVREFRLIATAAGLR